jgi:hypothetical protein
MCAICLQDVCPSGCPNASDWTDEEEVGYYDDLDDYDDEEDEE